MKEKMEKIKESFKNKYIKALSFFGFYIFFFVIVTLFSQSIIGNEPKENNKDNNTNAPVQDKWEMINNNYEYLYEIKIINKKEITNIVLQGKKYQNKQLFTRQINDELISNIYTFYNTSYLNVNNEWVEQPDFNIVAPSFNNNFIDANYIKDIIKDSKAKQTITNFDNSTDEVYVVNENEPTALNIKVTSLNNTIKTIKLTTSTLDITLQYKNINKVENFVVEH